MEGLIARRAADGSHGRHSGKPGAVQVRAVAILGLSAREHYYAANAFRNGDRVTVDVGLTDPLPGVIVAVRPNAR